MQSLTGDLVFKNFTLSAGSEMLDIEVDKQEEFAVGMQGGQVAGQESLDETW